MRLTAHSATQNFLNLPLESIISQNSTGLRGFPDGGKIMDVDMPIKQRPVRLGTARGCLTQRHVHGVR